MNAPDNLKYTKSHEWARLTDEGLVEVGITDHAQEALGDIVFLDLPDAGRKIAAGEEVAVVESVKAAADIYAPIAGEIVASNSAAADAPESVNDKPYGAWLFKIRPANAADLAALLDAAGYAGVVESGA